MKAIEAKLSRARELLELLQREVKAFEQSMPALRLEKGYKPGTSIYAFFAHLDIEVPLRFGVLSGEVVHQLRSSLDHLVTHFVSSEGETITRTHQFPIASTRKSYERQLARGCLASVPEAVQTVIERFQPYNAQDPRVSELLAVQELNNSDKHRLLAVVAAATQIGEQVRISCGENAAITGMSPPHLTLANGSEFFAIDFARCYADTNVDIDVQTSLALQRPRQLDWPFELAPLLSVLAQCERAVVHVVSQCLKAISANNG